MTWMQSSFNKSRFFISQQSSSTLIRVLHLLLPLTRCHWHTVMLWCNRRVKTRLISAQIRWCSQVRAQSCNRRTKLMPLYDSPGEPHLRGASRWICGLRWISCAAMWICGLRFGSWSLSLPPYFSPCHLPCTALKMSKKAEANCKALYLQ